MLLHHRRGRAPLGACAVALAIAPAVLASAQDAKIPISTKSKEARE